MCARGTIAPSFDHREEADIPRFGSGHRIGAYTLERKLGAGAFAEVWLAVQETGTLGFRKKVALKMVRPEKGEDEDEVQAFLREAGLVANLRHPNIVDTLSVSEDGGTLHIAMEFVDGGSLHQLVNRCLRHGLSLPNSVVCSLLIDICRGLAAAHDAAGPDGKPLRVVHRDLKLGNVLIDKTGVAKVADFGMAKAAGDVTATATGFVKGTPAYVAPEVWEGERTFTQGVDLFAVGCIAFALVIRRRLFDGENVASIYGQICKRTPEQEAAPVEERYPGLAPIVEKLLQRDPKDRYRCGKDVAVDLDDLLKRTPAAGEVRDFLWLLDRIDAIEEGDGAEEADVTPPFTIPDAAEAGWAAAIERATGSSVSVLPVAMSGAQDESGSPASDGESGDATDVPPSSAPSGVVRTLILPPREVARVGLATSMHEGIALKEERSALVQSRRRRERVQQSRRGLQMAILVLLGVLAVIVGLILGKSREGEATDPAPMAEPPGPPDLPPPPRADDASEVPEPSPTP